MNPNNQFNQNNQNQNVNSVPMSQEDLAKTQVLNLTDVKNVAKYEKKTSKKPAIFLMILGLLAIAAGIAYPYIETFIGDRTATEQKTSKKEKTETTDDAGSTQQNIAEDRLTCFLAQTGNADGTDTTITYLFAFSNNQLQNYTKTLNIVPTAESTIGATTIQTLFPAHQALDAVQINGYTHTTQQVESGIQVDVAVDLLQFDPTTLPDTHKVDTTSNVEYVVNTDKTTIQTTLTSTGYTCQ